MKPDNRDTTEAPRRTRAAEGSGKHAAARDDKRDAKRDDKQDAKRDAKRGDKGDAKGDEEDLSPPEIPDDAEVLLECKQVSVGYDKPILENIDLKVRRGEIVALLGGSGCGKSTLLRSIIGLQPPLAGEILIFGESVYELSPDKRNKLLSRTGTAFQQDALFGSMSLEDNVALPLHELTKLPAAVIREMVRMRLALVGLPGMQHRMPAQISGGQRKRAALARASILDPQIMFCDEPSAGLDPVIAAGIDETLLRFRKALGITMAVVTHELESIRTIADRAIMFAHGGIAAEGTIDELSDSDDPEIYGFFHRVADNAATAQA